MEEKKAATIHVSQVSTPEASGSPLPRTHTVTQYGPSHRERHWALRWFLLLLDVLLALSPAAFIAIAITAITYNNVGIHADDQRPITVLNRTFVYTYYSSGKAVQRAARVAVSIFPIIFAAIVGRFLKAYALHRAEHGSRMGVLEQLYGSQGLANTVQIGCALRGPKLLGLCLVLLWVLSPLGGQAVQRVLSETSYNVTRPTTIYYCNTSSLNAFSHKYAYAYDSESVVILLSTALMTNRFSRTHDVYGNIRIPLLNSSQSQSKSGVFRPVSNESEYSSMIGTIINLIDSEAPDAAVSKATNFEMLTSHLELACDDHKLFRYGAVINGSDMNAPEFQGLKDFVSWAGPLYGRRNLSNIDWSTFRSLLDVRKNETSEFYDPAYEYPLILDTIADPPEFIYVVQQRSSSPDIAATNDTTTDNVTVATALPYTLMAYQCSSKLVWVTSNVTCPDTTTCIVNSVRDDTSLYSSLKHPLFDMSLVRDSYTPLWLFLQIFDRFKQSSNAGWNTAVAESPIEPLDWYLAGAGSPYSMTAGQTMDFSSVSGANLSHSLSSLLNTVFLAGIQNTALASPASTNVSALDASNARSRVYDVDRTPYLGYNTVPAQATNVYTNNVYMVDRLFTTATITLSLLLMGLGFLSIYLRRRNTHPDVLGFVSTLTRDNPAFTLPPGAERLDGLDMARYYKYTSVQLVNTASLGDVQPRITLRRIHRSSAGDV